MTKWALLVGLRRKLRAVYRKVRFFGLAYRCPFCRSRLRTFLPFGFDFAVLKKHKVVGGGYRLKALCPVCNSLDRERLLYFYLLRKTDVFSKSRRVLHIAPEEQLKRLLSAQNNLHYLTADLLSRNVMIRMDITDIPFPDDSFDAIICNHVLEHVIDDHKAMAELYRVMKPDGWAVLQVPMSLSLDNTYEDFSVTTTEGREEAFGQSDHVRIYGKDYVSRLEQVDFKVNVFDWRAEAESFGGPGNLYGLNEDECVYSVQ
jgi:SAM-dependent methyltransferase